MNGALIGFIMAIVLGSTALTHYARMAHNNRIHARYGITSGQFLTLLTGMTRYVKIHKADLIVSVPIGTTSEIPLSDLVNEGDVTLGFSPINPFGQKWSLWVQQPTSGNIVAFVTSSGGIAMATASVAEIANHSSDKGGYVPQDNIYPGVDSSTAVGANRGWYLSLADKPNPGSGHLFGQIGLTDDELHDDVLYRVAVNGHPELNTMKVDLNADQNNIKNVGQLAAGGGVIDSLWPTGWSKKGIVSSDIYSISTIGAGKKNNAKTYMNASGDMYASGSLAIGTDKGAYPGNPCPQSGMISMQNDGSGRQLNCQQGYWKSITEPVSFYVPPTTQGFGGYARANRWTGGFSCPKGTADYVYVTLWYGNYGYSEGHLCM